MFGPEQAGLADLGRRIGGQGHRAVERNRHPCVPVVGLDRTDTSDCHVVDHDRRVGTDRRDVRHLDHDRETSLTAAGRARQRHRIQPAPLTTRQNEHGARRHTHCSPPAASHRDPVDGMSKPVRSDATGTVGKPKAPVGSRSGSLYTSWSGRAPSARVGLMLRSG